DRLEVAALLGHVHIDRIELALVELPPQRPDPVQPQLGGECVALPIGFEAKTEMRQEEPKDRIDHREGEVAVRDHLRDPGLLLLQLTGDALLEVEHVAFGEPAPLAPFEPDVVRMPARVIGLHVLEEGEASDRRCIDRNTVLELEVVEGNLPEHRHLLLDRAGQKSGTACASVPPSLSGATLTASPVASSVSIITPHSVASPSAGVNRPCGIPVRNRFSGSSASTPMTESKSPHIPASAMSAVPP